MTEDDGQEDKLVERLVAEAVKNVFAVHFDAKDFRPVIDYFEGGKGVEVGDTLAVKAVLDRIEKVPQLRKKAEEFARKVQPELDSAESRDASTAAAVEFILEGLHVHNKLNKTAKAGATAYRR